MPLSTRNVRLFVLITLVCVGVAVTYTFFSARLDQRSSGIATSAPPVAPPTSAPLAAPTARPLPEAEPAARSGTYLISVNVRDTAALGTVEFAPLDTIADRQPTRLHCDRSYFARDIGICLSQETKLLSTRTTATLVDASFRPLFDVRADGIPSRARISPDQRYAAFTVFVTGHSYSDTRLSTATLVIDLKQRATVANLEDFAVLERGSAVKSPDSNYWGVTFERDSNLFYATLRMRGDTYLVHGAISARTVTIVHKGVECPSLSPDGTRIAFKKGVSRGDWRLAVLDLASLTETMLAETRSVDDQVEWLDNEHILYAVTDPTPWMSIKVVNADGSGEPRTFARGASSPSVVRQFRH